MLLLLMMITTICAMLVMFQLEKLLDNLRPVNSSEIQPLLVELVNATGRRGLDEPRAMTAKDLSANVRFMTKLAHLYNIRRRSLILQQSAMNVSCQSYSLPIINDRFRNYF